MGSNRARPATSLGRRIVGEPTRFAAYGLWQEDDPAASLPFPSNSACRRPEGIDSKGGLIPCSTASWQAACPAAGRSGRLFPAVANRPRTRGNVPSSRLSPAARPPRGPLLALCWPSGRDTARASPTLRATHRLRSLASLVRRTSGDTQAQDVGAKPRLDVEAARRPAAPAG